MIVSPSMLLVNHPGEVFLIDENKTILVINVFRLKNIKVLSDNIELSNYHGIPVKKKAIILIFL